MHGYLLRYREEIILKQEGIKEESDVFNIIENDEVEVLENDNRKFIHEDTTL